MTGGCGFIGSHFIELLLKRYPNGSVLNVDKMTYAASPKTAEWLQGLATPDNYQLLELDIADPSFIEMLSTRKFELVINFAAETHVDRSILDHEAFLRTNIIGLKNMLLTSRLHNARLVHISTDEVYGPLIAPAAASEASPLQPSSDYAASKASADLLALAGFRTCEDDVVVTRCTNNLGPRQFPEKLIPLAIANAIDNEPIPVYGDGLQVRDWIAVGDHCEAILAALQKGEPGEIYNVGARGERTNLYIVESILDRLSRPRSLIRHTGDRPGHDRRYALDASKIERELGWRPRSTVEQALDATIQWYVENESWWRPLRDKNYRKYYEANYAPKLGEASL